MKKRALFSVSDKTGLVECARRVHALGYEILSTGGTQAALEAGGVPTVGIGSVTQFPECLDGRLKTLHPVVYGGILADRGNPDHMAQLELLGIEPIDIVVINLHPIKQVILKEGAQLSECMENIDAWGPPLIRAAAKNWQDVVVMSSPSDYESVLDALEKGTLSREARYRLAVRVFEHTAHYDALIATYLREELSGYPETLTLTFEKAQDLRYGENPHQSAVFYRDVAHLQGTPAAAEQLHGPEMSFNNFHDVGTTADLLREFDEPCAVILKHATPCGVGLGETISEAWRNAYVSDPVSAFGGVVALNRVCDEETAVDIVKTFFEIVCAPGYTDEALGILMENGGLRVLQLDPPYGPDRPFPFAMQRITGGLLLEQADTCLYEEEAGRPRLSVVTERAPTQEERDKLAFAWKVVKHVRSHAIVITDGKRTLGIGSGQTSRIMAVEQALRHAGDSARGAVMASDAFFPFADCAELARQAGITAVMQPGGSIRDEESVNVCNRCGMAMVFTHMRHFRH